MSHEFSLHNLCEWRRRLAKPGVAVDGCQSRSIIPRGNIIDRCWVDDLIDAHNNHCSCGQYWPRLSAESLVLVKSINDSLSRTR